MFTLADWEDDVPESSADFKTMHSKTKSKPQNKAIKSGRIEKKKSKNGDDLQKREKNQNTNIHKIKFKQGNARINKNKHATPIIAIKSNDGNKNTAKNKRKKNNNQANNEEEDIDKKLISDKKMKLNDHIKSTDIEKMFGGKAKKKEKLKKLLEANLERRLIKPKSGNLLRERMLERLRAARFRYLNEKLYLSESKDAMQLFKNDPESFQVYHDGFRQQVRKWPLNPLDVIIKNISKMPKHTKVADMGCGEARLAKLVPQDVRSFDLVSLVEGVEVCDMAKTPLKNAEMDVAVYCLALMGTNMKDYFIEANRILKVGGLMKIAEVESRFKDVKHFIKTVESYGFSLSNFDDSKQLFYFFDFRKERDLGNKTNKLIGITLDPCVYKKR